jgi:hypothetical protein
MERIETPFLSPGNQPPESQPPHIKTPLLPHQVYSLQRMIHLETSAHTGIRIGDEMILSSYGILGERAGTGKTLTMLSHISQMSARDPSPVHISIHPSSSPSFFSMVQKDIINLFNTLIVVPHTLFHQWHAEVNRTNFSYTLLKSQKDIDTECLAKIENSHVTLISNTLLPSLSALLSSVDYMWERIVYDEADMLRISSTCKPLQTKMTWLITSRYRNITHANQQIHSHVVKQLPQEYVESLSMPMQSYVAEYVKEHPMLTLYKTTADVYFKSILQNTHPSRGYFVIKTEESFLESSLCIPPPVRQILLCNPTHPRPNETTALLESGNIEGAVLSMYPREVTFESLLEGSDRNTRCRLQANKTCSICYEPAETMVPCITPCCMNLFCGRCIATWISINSICPLCKAILPPSSLLKLKGNVPRGEKGYTKYDRLISLLQDGDVNNQYIVFSRNTQEVYAHIVNNLPHLIDKVDILHGNKSTIANILSDFTTKKLRVLCFSTDSLGVDLYSATHMIVMNRLQGEEDTIIGRAQRIGRKQPLQYIELMDWHK